jgi:hypothetical protein
MTEIVVTRADECSVRVEHDEVLSLDDAGALVRALADLLDEMEDDALAAETREHHAVEARL